MRIGVIWVVLTSRNTTLASTQVSAFYENSPAMIIIMPVVGIRGIKAYARLKMYSVFLLSCSPI